MVFVRWAQSSNSLVVRQAADYILEEELKILRNQGITGELFVQGMDRRGVGQKKARVLVLMHTNVAASVDLRQPDGTNAIYLQNGNGFLLLPTNTPTTQKTLSLNRYNEPMGGVSTVYPKNGGWMTKLRRTRRRNFPSRLVFSSRVLLSAPVSPARGWQHTRRMEERLQNSVPDPPPAFSRLQLLRSIGQAA